MNIVITGHAGFIGFHLSRALLEAGHSVLGLDALTDYYDPELKQARLRLLTPYPRFQQSIGHIEAPGFIDTAFRAFQPTIVVHLAAQAGVRYSIENPGVYLESNVIGTHKVAEAARDAGVDHLLIASTSSAYGGNEELPFTETQRTATPMSLYAATKIATEAIAHSYSHLWSIPTTCFRFFTVYGPWGRPDMALFKFAKAIEANDPIDVYGYGEMARDFTYIDDLVSGILSLIPIAPVKGEPVSTHDTLSPVAPFRTVNIGGGSPTGLLEFITAIEEAMGKSAVKRMLPMQPGDVVSTHASTELLTDLVGAVPKTTVKSGVTAFIDWYQEYKGLGDL